MFQMTPERAQTLWLDSSKLRRPQEEELLVGLGKDSMEQAGTGRNTMLEFKLHWILPGKRA